MDLAIDTVVGGRYRVEERLGSGAMGIVYRVRHTKLGRAFAIKVLHAPLVANPKLRRRFEREAEIASSLRHRNVVGVIDVGDHDDLSYIVMELADGQPLSAMLALAPLPAARVIACIRQLCDGLSHAHEAGLIHRDFKPDNVIVEEHGETTLKIIDFGIAIVRDESARERERLTTEGIVLGTPHYMAPEHASGADVDHRIDLFALGVICFEMLTGKMPFDGDGVDVARSNIMYDAPSMRVRVPDLEVDPLLEAFTRKLMARQRDLRFSSAKAARDMLDLIERDRAAAAVALGLAKPRSEPTSAIDGAAPIPSRPIPANAAVQAPRRASTLEPEVAAALPSEPPPETDRVVPVLHHRRASVIGAGMVLGAMGIVLALAMSSGHAPSQIADTVPHTPAPTVVETSRAHEPAPPPATVDVEPAPMPGPRPVVPPAPGPAKIAKPAPPSTIGETPLEVPTATKVAALYGAVGRALGQLQQAKGSDATIDLWPRFRHIRINDGISTPAARRETHEVLQRLQRDVDARRR